MLNCDTPIAEPDPAEFTPACTTQSIFERGAGNVATTDAILDNYNPMADSVLLNADVAFENDWFTTVDFIGAVGSEDWTTGWTVGL